jgi:epoxyqueuosine reductase
MRRMFDGPFQSRVCVDTSAIVERELATAAGIGWIGKNTMLLHRSLGSFFVLGEIITDLELAPDPLEPDHCGTCTRCLAACPTAAFPQPYVMDASRCISYLTIEHRGEIDRDLAAKMGDWVFGCDACQAACPFNARAPETAEPRFCATVDDAAPVLEDILSWDEAAYKSFVTGKATSRATLHMWKRNAEIAIRSGRHTATRSARPARR